MQTKTAAIYASLFMGLLGYILSTLTNNINILIGALISLTTIVGTLMVSEIFLTERNNRTLSKFIDLVSDPKILNQLTELSISKLKMSSKLGVLPKDIGFLVEEYFLQLLIELTDKTNSLSEGEIKIDRNEIEKKFINQAMDVASREMKAISITPNYWKEAQGITYLTKQQLAINKGINITRVFIIKQDDLEKYHDVFDNQSSIGVKCFVAFLEQVDKDLIQDIVIYDDILVRRATEINPITNSRMARYSVIQEDVKDYSKMFENIMALAQEYSTSFNKEIQQTSYVGD